MSASAKKKLRNAQEAEKMTEKQLTEQKEAKKLKIQTTIFVVVIALMVVFAVYTAISSSIAGSGMRERNTVALTVDGQDVSNAELNYYFVDAVNNFNSQYGSYAAMFGLDTTKPLDEQVANFETGATWADDFTDTAIENVKAVYALNAAAAEAGYTLTDAEKSNIDLVLNNMRAYGQMYGYADTEEYLKAMYGKGATVESFTEYYTMCTLASSFQNHYATSLTYDDAALREAESENYALYSDYSYNSYYLSTSKFLEGGTENEDGTTTYSDEEKEAARAAAEAAAKALTANKTVEELDAAIAALPVNADATTPAASTAYTNNPYNSINTSILDWVVDESRQVGDVGFIEATTSSSDEEGNVTSTVNGYYVVIFNGVNDNVIPLVNVRHILIDFEGGTYDQTLNETVYSDEEKAAAKEKIEAIKAAYEANPTEENFATLAKDNSTDPGSASNGGLYEDVYPGQMVVNFNDWCFAEGRAAGDVDVVETEYGYHLMYYVGQDEMTFRDLLIKNDLVNADTNAWYNDLVEAVSVTEKSIKYLTTNLVLGQ